MSNTVKITDYNSVSNLNDTDILLINQNGENKKVTKEKLLEDVTTQIEGVNASLNENTQNIANINATNIATDLNSVGVVGQHTVHRFTIDSLNTPYNNGLTTATYGIVETNLSATSYGLQIVYPSGVNNIFVRALSNGTWLSFQKLANDSDKINKTSIVNNLLATVSGSVLDATQGTILLGLINNINGTGSATSDLNSETRIITQYGASTLNSPYTQGLSTAGVGICLTFLNGGLQIAFSYMLNAIYMRHSKGTWVKVSV